MADTQCPTPLPQRTRRLPTTRTLLVSLVLAGLSSACSSSASYRQCAEIKTDRVALLPERLSDTGLFADMGQDVLADDVLPFAPRFPLWTDGAEKRRFVLLPEAAVIDTGDMDAWRFPEGTKLWKEFTRDGVRVETRVFEKIGPADDDWVGAAYAWNAEGTDAVLLPAGKANALGTAHDLPSAAQCLGCHGGTASNVLGFSAVQLPWTDDDGVSLSSLVAQGRLSVAPAGPFDLPGDATKQRALGTLHATCAHCHNQHRPERAGPRCFDPRRDFDLSLRTDELASIEDTPVFKTAVNVVIVAGDPDSSALIKRARGDLEVFQARMPPLGTEALDPTLLPLLDSFIRSLPQKRGP